MMSADRTDTTAPTNHGAHNLLIVSLAARGEQMALMNPVPLVGSRLA
jgi:hypothetical protein